MENIVNPKITALYFYYNFIGFDLFVFCQFWIHFIHSLHSFHSFIYSFIFATKRRFCIQYEIGQKTKQVGNNPFPSPA